MKPLFSIVLVSPEIPWNVGAIGRTAVALGARVVIIKPTLVDLSDKAVKRAGLDYWAFVDLKMYESWEEFLAAEKVEVRDLYILSTKAEEILFSAKISKGAYLIFGAESKGLPPFYHQNYGERLFKLPMYGDKIRSLNLANTVTAVAYEAVRQIKF
jgi:tRNA (cytidine/uridine-2'-O-)-methyltransferase